MFSRKTGYDEKRSCMFKTLLKVCYPKRSAIKSILKHLSNRLFYKVFAYKLGESLEVYGRKVFGPVNDNLSTIISIEMQPSKDELPPLSVRSAVATDKGLQKYHWKTRRTRKTGNLYPQRRSLRSTATSL